MKIQFKLCKCIEVIRLRLQRTRLTRSHRYYRKHRKLIIMNVNVAGENKRRRDNIFHRQSLRAWSYASI